MKVGKAPSEAVKRAKFEEHLTASSADHAKLVSTAVEQQRTLRQSLQKDVSVLAAASSLANAWAVTQPFFVLCQLESKDLEFMLLSKEVAALSSQLNASKDTRKKLQKQVRRSVLPTARSALACAYT